MTHQGIRPRELSSRAIENSRERQLQYECLAAPAWLHRTLFTRAVGGRHPQNFKSFKHWDGKKKRNGGRESENRSVQAGCSRCRQSTRVIAAAAVASCITAYADLNGHRYDCIYIYCCRPHEVLGAGGIQLLRDCWTFGDCITSLIDVIGPVLTHRRITFLFA